MEKLLILANLGRVRPITFTAAGDDPSQKPHLHELSDKDTDLRTPSISDVVTDQAGRFSQGGGVGQSGGTSNSEQHNLQGELDRKALERVAARISEILAGENHPSWWLVAPQPITPSLKEALSAGAKGSLAQSIAADLTRSPLADLEKRFLKELV